jgi:5'-nucleotidase (lipoprotein e(P4) family)
MAVLLSPHPKVQQRSSVVANFSRLSAVAFTALLLAGCAEKAETPAAVATEPGTATASATPATPPVPADDNLNATLWMQHSVEYAGSTESAFALAKIRLDQALKDRRWTAATEQTGNFSKLPPAIICDVDETLLDNSAYQAWNVTAGTTFSNETWGKFVQAQISTAVPGAVDFANYATSKGVTVFYVTNRTVDGEQATRDNMAKLAFPMGGNVDTFLMSKEKEDWTSAKGTRRAFIAQNYRVLLLLGDNFGDFVDAYKGTEADREKVYAANASHWGHDWIMLPNPAYGSWEAVPYKFNYGASPDEMRDAKKKALTPWSGPVPQQ